MKRDFESGVGLGSSRTQSPADILRKAKALIATPDKWHRGDFFAGFKDQEPDLEDVPRGTPADIWGAVALAYGAWGVTPADEALEAATPKGFCDIHDFNDDPKTTHADVLALFDRALGVDG